MKQSRLDVDRLEKEVEQLSLVINDIVNIIQGVENNGSKNFSSTNKSKGANENLNLAEKLKHLTGSLFSQSVKKSHVTSKFSQD